MRQYIRCVTAPWLTEAQEKKTKTGIATRAWLDAEPREDVDARGQMGDWYARWGKKKVGKRAPNANIDLAAWVSTEEIVSVRSTVEAIEECVSSQDSGGGKKKLEAMMKRSVTTQEGGGIYREIIRSNVQEFYPL